MFKIICDFVVYNDKTDYILKMVDCKPCYMNNIQLTYTSRPLDKSEAVLVATLYSQHIALSSANPNFQEAYNEIISLYKKTSTDQAISHYKFLAIFDFNPNLNSEITMNELENLNLLYQEVFKTNGVNGAETVSASITYLYFNNDDPKAKPRMFQEMNCNDKKTYILDSNFFDFIDADYVCNGNFPHDNNGEL